MAERFNDRTIHDHVVEAIGRMVFDPEVASTTLPTESELTERFQVSRGTLREAVKSLTAKGILEVRPRTGTRVLPRRLWNNLDPDVLRWAIEIETDRTTLELNELRMAVEPMAASLAARFASADAVSGLWRSFVRMEDATATRDFAAFVDADSSFHRDLLSAGGNELFRSLGHMIDAALYESFGSIAEDVSEVADSVALHRAVVVAVSAKDPDAAWQAMTAVIGGTVDRIGLKRSDVPNADKTNPSDTP